MLVTQGQSMDWKTFFANIISSLAWPAAAVAIIVLLRIPVARLVTLLRKLKWKDLELDFAEKLEEAEKEADAAQLPAIKPASLESADDPAKNARLTLRQLA